MTKILLLKLKTTFNMQKSFNPYIRRKKKNKNIYNINNNNIK